MQKLTEEQKRLVENHHDLIYGFMSKHNLIFDDWYGIIAIGLCKASISYDETKGKFSTIAYLSMQNEVSSQHKYFYREKRDVTDKIIVHLDKLAYDGDNGNDTITISDVISDEIDYEEETIYNMALKKTNKRLNPVQKELMNLILLNYTITEIGKILNLTRQAIYYRLKPIKSIIKQEYALESI